MGGRAQRPFGVSMSLKGRCAQRGKNNVVVLQYITSSLPALTRSSKKIFSVLFDLKYLSPLTDLQTCNSATRAQKILYISYMYSRVNTAYWGKIADQTANLSFRDYPS
jgi:hypothetical protein